MFSVFETNKINELKVELPADKTPFLNKYGEEYFLKLYMRIKLIECKMESQYHYLEKYLLEYYNFSGVSGALAFIDKKTTKTNIYTSSEFNPHYFNSKVLTSDKTSDNIVENTNQTTSVSAPAATTTAGTSGY